MCTCIILHCTNRFSLHLYANNTGSLKTMCIQTSTDYKPTHLMQLGHFTIFPYKSKCNHRKWLQVASFFLYSYTPTVILDSEKLNYPSVRTYTAWVQLCSALWIYTVHVGIYQPSHSWCFFWDQIFITLFFPSETM